MSETSLEEHPQALVLPTPHHPAYSSIDSENGEIRLLELLPGRYDDALEMRLHSKKGNDKRTYEALSYAWGTAMSSHEALLDGAPVSMTESLDLGLRRLRYKKRSRILWVDALCINQNDVRERSHQVQHMAMIYSSAENVLIWLGEWVPSATCPDQGRCETTFSGLLTSSRRINSIPTAVFWSRLLSWGISRFLMPSGLSYHFWHHLMDIVSQPWFGRTWIIQEFVLAKRDPVVHIGRHVARWRDLFYLISEIRTVSNKIHSGKELEVLGKDFEKIIPKLWGSFHAILSLNEVRFSSERNRSLSWLLQYSFYAEATDKRDKIYGLLGICRFQVADPIVPDYTKSLLQVLAETTVAEIREESPNCYLKMSFPHDLPFFGDIRTPSWMFGFHRLDLSDRRSTNRQRKNLPLDERKRRNRQLRLSEDCQTLFTRGRYVGTICAVLPWLTGRYDAKSKTTPVTARLYDFYHRVLKPLSITPKRLHKVLNFHHDDVREDLAAFTTHLLAPESSFLPDLTRICVHDTGIHSCYLDDACLIVTKEGEIALTYHEGRADIRAGDVIVNLFGYNIPFILRPLENASVYTMLNVAEFEAHRDRHDYKWVQIEAESVEEYALV